MKYLLLALCLFSFTSNTVSFKKDKIVEAKQAIQAVATYIEGSNLPHQDVIKLERTLDLAFSNLSDSAENK